MTQTIAKSFRDMFSTTVFLFVLKVTFISLVLTAGVLWLINESLFAFVASYLSWLPWEWAVTTGASVASIAASYMVFIIMLSMVTSFMVEPLLIKLAKKHYPNKEVVGKADPMTSFIVNLKSSMWMSLIFMLTFPLMFIPLLGAVYMLWLWSILLKQTTMYDVGSLFVADTKALNAKTKKSTMLAMIAAGFNYIPALNIFSAVFAQILFLHDVLGKKEA